MPYGTRRGYSDYLLGRHVREMRAAAAHAEAIGNPLNMRIHINWNRTSIGDDPDGQVLAAFRHRVARWLRERETGYYAIAVREHPRGSTPRPNDHMLLHVPSELLAEFKRAVPSLLPRGTGNLDAKAVLVDANGTTERARSGTLTYICKGVAPRAGQLLGIKPTQQGRVHGKRYTVSATLGLTARQNHRQAAQQQVRSVEPKSPAASISSWPVESSWTGKKDWWLIEGRRA
jgi:hypothetical protein